MYREIKVGRKERSLDMTPVLREITLEIIRNVLSPGEFIINDDANKFGGKDTVDWFIIDDNVGITRRDRRFTKDDIVGFTRIQGKLVRFEPRRYLH